MGKNSSCFKNALQVPALRGSLPTVQRGVPGSMQSSKGDVFDGETMHARHAREGAGKVGEEVERYVSVVAGPADGEVVEVGGC